MKNKAKETDWTKEMMKWSKADIINLLAKTIQENQSKQPLPSDEEYIPYMGWCDVDGCDNEASSGGMAWNDTGYWKVCDMHAADFYKNNRPVPKMKASSIKRENSRNKTTGYLPKN